MRIRHLKEDFLIRIGNNIATSRNVKCGGYWINYPEKIVIFG